MPFSGRAKRSFSGHLPGRQLLDQEGSEGSMLTPPVSRSKSSSSRSPFTKSRSPFAGSLTELSSAMNESRPRSLSGSTALSPLSDHDRVAISHKHRKRVDLTETSMSSAPVETLAMRRRPSQSRVLTSSSSADSHLPPRPRGCLSRIGRACCCIVDCVYPARARIAVPMDLFFFLLVVGFLSSALGFGMDVVVEALTTLRVALIEAIPGWLGLLPGSQRVDSVWLRLLGWISPQLLLCWLAIYSTASIAPAAAGSGIPEMKAILAGERERKYLARPTLVAKVLGLCLALGAGLPLGKEGPFVHVCCCIVNLVLKFTPGGLFSRLARSKPMRQQLLAVGCAAGVTGTFGAPVGGVLFSIEVWSPLHTPPTPTPPPHRPTTPTLPLCRSLRTTSSSPSTAAASSPPTAAALLAAREVELLELCENEHSHPNVLRLFGCEEDEAPAVQAKRVHPRQASWPRT